MAENILRTYKDLTINESMLWVGSESDYDIDYYNLLQDFYDGRLNRRETERIEEVIAFSRNIEALRIFYALTNNKKQILTANEYRALREIIEPEIKGLIEYEKDNIKRKAWEIIIIK